MSIINTTLSNFFTEAATVLTNAQDQPAIKPSRSVEWAKQSYATSHHVLEPQPAQTDLKTAASGEAPLLSCEIIA
jgi:hypothetical protein